MALYQIDELEYMGNEYFDMVEFEDDGTFENPQQAKCEEDADYEDDAVDSHKQKADTSALEARNGKDIQGIQWELMNFNRDKYRETRLKQYKNYESLPHSHYELEKECKQVEKGSAFYDFQFNTRLVKSTIVHFQERTAI